ncbi:Flp family type IVb pilin [Lachnoclostridium sp. Marseille-P6806]|uniref:Flp family type IVb pilin n=1 Tax=Lachnoclostridium sp. Marseille-P6806 TaxID=2364793 RepID=UPI00103098D7|nr:Flp family type IVb pilin [Lachnoclostridium sp. Marseille-P6806]
MKKFLFDEESGQGMVEYGLILALVAVAAIAAFRLLGTSLNTKITNVENDLK